MENSTRPTDLGPQPGEPSPPPALSASRRQVLTTLRQQPHPVPLATLTTATGLHANTVREHLDALLQAGLVRRRRSTPAGRGRPAWRYEARDATAGRQGAEYVALAGTLAAFISRTSSSPRADAIDAGTQWGRDLVAGQDPAAAASPDARREIVDLLSEIGFAPTTETEHGTIRLTRCPLLETARTYPDVVCGVHLGIVRGALAAYGADPARAELAPFAEPGACLLDLRPARDRRSTATPSTATPSTATPSTATRRTATRRTDR